MTETCSQECAKKKIKGVLSLFEKSNKVLKKELRLLKGVLTCAHSEEIFLSAPMDAIVYGISIGFIFIRN